MCVVFIVFLCLYVSTFIVCTTNQSRFLVGVHLLGNKYFLILILILILMYMVREWKVYIGTENLTYATGLSLRQTQTAKSFTTAESHNGPLECSKQTSQSDMSWGLRARPHILESRRCEPAVVSQFRGCILLKIVVFPAHRDLGLDHQGRPEIRRLSLICITSSSRPYCC